MNKISAILFLLEVLSFFGFKMFNLFNCSNYSSLHPYEQAGRYPPPHYKLVNTNNRIHYNIL